jgi:NAD(P)-dependent dehydrogenase (short-subunit alcohol dehydrogenase family)
VYLKKEAPMVKTESPVAIVTGAGGLLGSAICERLRVAGALVVAIDIVPTAAPGTASFEVDVCDEAGLARTALEVEARYGRADWLVHTAAVTGRTGKLTESVPLMDVNLSVWDKVLRVNLTGALLCVRAFLKLLQQASSGRVIFFGSLQGSVPTIGSGAYAVSKAALGGLTRQLAAELAPDGIRVNIVSPGLILPPEDTTAAGNDGQMSTTPLGRFGSPIEVAEIVANLLGSGFGHVTGAEIPVDGGEHLRPRSSPQVLFSEG